MEEVAITEGMREYSKYLFVKGFIAGTVGGVVSKIIGHPFDTVKVRLQTQDMLTNATKIQDGNFRYAGALDCFQKMIKYEGIGSLYKGMASPLVGAALEIAVIFAANEQLKSVFKSFNSDPQAPLTLTQLVIAGGLAGTCVSFVLTPTELIKCRLQVQQGKRNKTSGKYIGPIDVVKQCLREGPTSLFKGHTGTMVRETFGNMAWFGVYEGLCKILTPIGKRREELGLWAKATAGAAAGVVFWAVPFPADVVKSCMQTMTTETNNKSPGFFQVFGHIMRTQGVRALYKGFGVTALRAAPCNGAIFVCYETVLQYLNNNFKRNDNPTIK